jgi:hypothetical protein
MPDIPNFTKQSWQRGRSDDKLLRSILDGKNEDMPAFSGKINKDQARDLVAHVREFAPTVGKSESEKQQKAASPRDFDKEFRRLQKELDELKKQMHEVPKVPAETNPSKPPEGGKSALAF